jgi:hypothetical protein
MLPEFAVTVRFEVPVGVTDMTEERQRPAVWALAGKEAVMTAIKSAAMGRAADWCMIISLCRSCLPGEERQPVGSYRLVSCRVGASQVRSVSGLSSAGDLLV